MAQRVGSLASWARTPTLPQGPFDTCGSAEAWLRSADHIGERFPRDNSLRGPCTALARDLRSRAHPFVVYSGHSRSQEAPSEFADAPWVVRPVLFKILLACTLALAVAGGIPRLRRTVVEISP